MARGDRTLRKSSLFLGMLLTWGSIFFFLMALSGFQSRADLSVRDMRDQVEALRLTDLCLFTEARYTRNPSQTDLDSAFQDHPFSLEHFPSGSFGRSIREGKR